MSMFKTGTKANRTELIQVRDVLKQRLVHVLQMLAVLMENLVELFLFSLSPIDVRVINIIGYAKIREWYNMAMFDRFCKR